MIIAFIATAALLIVEHNAVRQERKKFPVVKKSHRIDHPDVIPYEKFRARRLIDEKQRLQSRS